MHLALIWRKFNAKHINVGWEGSGCFTATGNYIPGMWGSFQFLISLSTKLPWPGPVPRKPWPWLVGVMYYNVTFITGTMYITKSEARSRTQSLTANVFPNLQDHIYPIDLESLRLNFFGVGIVSDFMECHPVQTGITVQTSQMCLMGKESIAGILHCQNPASLQFSAKF